MLMELCTLNTEHMEMKEEKKLIDTMRAELTNLFKTPTHSGYDYEKYIDVIKPRTAFFLKVRFFSLTRPLTFKYYIKVFF